MAEHLDLGVRGEDMAADFLVRRNFQILDRRLRQGGVEIDIVARLGDVIHFVEVKTRRARSVVPSAAMCDTSPEAAVGRAKIERLERAAEAYMQQRGDLCEASIDLVAIVLDRGDDARISYYPHVNR